MIHDYAIEPELVATWHDRRAAYPFVCQMGLGHRRVPCTFPALTWQKRVVQHLQNEISSMDPSAQQQAQKNIEVLLRHIQECSTRRSGALREHDPWIDAAVLEHGQYPFGGILVRSSEMRASYLVAADRLGVAEVPAWTPPAPPVPREAAALALALTPLLRSATQLRFVDPHFDAADGTFLEPMREYLRVAQTRRSLGDLKVQIHFAITREKVKQAERVNKRAETEESVAAAGLGACVGRVGPLLDPRIQISAFAWGDGPTGVRMHNRYLLTEVGGVALLTGLDENVRGAGQTDDLTILSREQHVARWSEFCAGGMVYKPIASRAFSGARSGGV